MKRSFALLLTLASLLLLQGCGSDEDVETADTAQAHRALISRANEIQEAVVEGRLLGASSERDRLGLTSSIRDARNALVRLARDPKDKLGIELGFRALKEIEKVHILRGDMGMLQNFYRELGDVVSVSARLAGVDLGEVTWSQYNYSFSDDVKPFATFSDGAAWATGISLDKPYVRVRSIRKKNQSWLLSPSFDLTKLARPSFRISHNTSVERNDSLPDNFNRILINQTLFKVYVSTSYNDGDKLETKDWVDVSTKLGAMPAGVDFHNVESAYVDLTPFISDNTTIAFVYNEDTPVIGRHYTSWQLNRFELFGAGELVKVSPRAAPLNTTEIEGNDLAPFSPVAQTAPAPLWEHFQIGSSPRFAKVSARSAPGVSWLMSPKYKIKNVDRLSLTIKEVVRDPKFEAMEIFISTDYNGGDPEHSKWDKLVRSNTDGIAPGAWVDVVSGPFDLSSYFGEEVVVALKFTSNAGDIQEWELASLVFNGEGESITSNRYPITFKVPGGVDPDENSIKKFNFNYGNEGFTSESVSGSPASFSLTTRDGRQYFSISAFRSKNEGVTRLISPAVELTPKEGKKIALSVTQNFNFYDAAAQAKEKLLRILLIDEEGQESELDFNTVPSGTNFDIVTSEKLGLEKFSGQKVKVAFEYGSKDPTFAQWSLYELGFEYVD